MKLKKLMQSFNGFNKLMIKKQLNKNTLKFTQKCVTDFFEYCKKNEIKKISDDILEKYYIDKYGKCSKSLNPKYTRPLSIAIEFAEKRDYSTTRQTYKKYHLDIEYEECLSRYFYYLQHKYKNPKSIKWVGTLFFLYLQNKSKNIRDVEEIDFTDFLSQEDVIRNSIDTIRVRLKILCIFLNKNELNRKLNLELIFTKGKSKHREKLLSCFTVLEVRNILSSINIESKSGKQLYAILTIIVYLGLRIGDVINLKFINIDFVNDKIKIIQVKTQTPLETPLIDEVKYPLLDHINNARPNNIKSEYIFLTRKAPYKNYKTGASIYTILKTHIKKIGIDCGNRKVGSHALRHSLATNMLSNNTKIEVIGSVLGHSSSNVTRAYISLDNKNLHSLSLEVPYVLSR